MSGMSIDELRNTVSDLAAQFHDATYRQEREKAKQLADTAKPLREELRKRMATERLGTFAGACPIAWIRKASAAQIEAAITHPALLRLAAEEDAMDRSALILGPSKIGKSTTCALAFCRRNARPKTRDGEGFYHPSEDSRALVWTTARALSTCARWHPLGDGEPHDLAAARRATVLVLDDLGIERDPAELIDVIHARYEAGLPTWTTSGLGMDELRAKYGEAITRRLVEGQTLPGRLVVCFEKAKAL